MGKIKRKKKYKKRKEYKWGLMLSVMLPFIFLFTIWLPYYDSNYTFIVLTIFSIYTILTIIGVMFRIERLYTLIGLGSFILVSIFCLFSGLKAANGVIFLQIILIVIIFAVFVIGFWGEAIIPMLKGKDWFKPFSLGVVLFMVMPVLFVAGTTMGGYREWDIGIMKSIFGLELGDRIISYLFGLGFPLLFINLVQSLYRMKDDVEKTSEIRKKKG